MQDDSLVDVQIARPLTESAAGWRRAGGVVRALYARPISAISTSVVIFFMLLAILVNFLYANTQETKAIVRWYFDEGRVEGVPFYCDPTRIGAFAIEPDELAAVAHEAATKIAAKRPRVVRAAKAALNLIDTFDLQKHYRLEQGFTYELNLYGDGDAARDEFVSGTRIVTRDSDR